MPVQIYDDAVTTITAQPSVGDSCSVSPVDEQYNLVQNQQNAFDEVCCPELAISPPTRMTDSRVVFSPRNGVATEQQNFRQISGFSDTTNSASPDYTVSLFCFQGREWGRRLQVSDTTSAIGITTLLGLPLPSEYQETNPMTYEIEEGFAFVGPASFSTTQPLQYYVSNDLVANNDAYGNFTGNNSLSYAAAFANGVNVGYSQSNYNLSSSDLMSVYDWSNGAYRLHTERKMPERSLNRPRSTPTVPFTPNEPNQVKATKTLNTDRVYLVHTSVLHARLNGEPQSE